jgi:hypothetical protein
MMLMLGWLVAFQCLGDHCEFDMRGYVLWFVFQVACDCAGVQVLDLPAGAPMCLEVP